MTRHTITHADQAYQGDCQYGGYSPDGRRGIEIQPLHTHKFGAVVVADVDAICDDATATATGGTAALSATGTLVSSSVATMDVPRNVSIQTATGGAASATFTVTGTDIYGESMTEDIAGPTAAAGTPTASGVKAFNTVTNTAVDIAVTGNIQVGSGNRLGAPVKMATKGDVVSASRDGGAITPTIVVGLATGTASTATTADVRGTLTATSAYDGTATYTVQFAPANIRDKVYLFGNAQA